MRPLSWDKGQICYSHTADLRLPEANTLHSPSTSHEQAVPLAWPRGATTQISCVPPAPISFSQERKLGRGDAQAL